MATDIAARGLDVAQLPLVVNFELPLVVEDYVPRVGRTGRAGQHGRAVSLVSASEAGLLRQIQQVVAAPLERIAAPIVDATDARPPIDRVPTRMYAAHGSRSGRGASNGHGGRDRQIAARPTLRRRTPRGPRRPNVVGVTAAGAGSGV